MIKLVFVLVAIAGYIANINDKKELSYWLWSSSNLYWMYYNIHNREPQMALMFAVYLAFCLYGLSKNYLKSNDYNIF